MRWLCRLAVLLLLSALRVATVDSLQDAEQRYERANAAYVIRMCSLIMFR